MYDFFSRLRFPSFAAIVSLFWTPRSVGSALVGFRDTIQTLNGVETHHRQQAADKVEIINDLHQDVNLHNDVANQASSVATKLTALITA